MSVCRLAEDSDVYVYRANSCCYYCHFCTFNDGREVLLLSRRATRGHLLEHVRAGDKVPRSTLVDLSWRGALRDWWFDLRARFA